MTSCVQGAFFADMTQVSRGFHEVAPKSVIPVPAYAQSLATSVSR